MKIRRPDDNDYLKVYALLSSVFNRSDYEKKLIEKLNNNNQIVNDWVCIIRNRVVAYIAFTNAYKGKEVCGLHLAPLAVKPDFQNQGIGSELIRFALRQKDIKGRPVFVLGDVDFYKRFGFEKSKTVLSPFDKKNKNFMLIGSFVVDNFIIGYESSF